MPAAEPASPRRVAVTAGSCRHPDRHARPPSRSETVPRRSPDGGADPRAPLEVRAVSDAEPEARPAVGDRLRAHELADVKVRVRGPEARGVAAGPDVVAVGDLAARARDVLTGRRAVLIALLPGRGRAGE